MIRSRTLINGTLVFSTLLIAGGVFGVLLHKNNVRLPDMIPKLDNTYFASLFGEDENEFKNFKSLSLEISGGELVIENDQINSRQRIIPDIKTASLGWPDISVSQIDFPKFTKHDFETMWAKLPSLPEIKLPEFKWSEMPEIKLPKFALPEITWPKIDITAFKIPQVKIPATTLPKPPKIILKKIDWLDAAWSEMAKIKMPELKLPELKFPEFSLPEFASPSPSDISLYNYVTSFFSQSPADALAAIAPAAGTEEEIITLAERGADPEKGVLFQSGVKKKKESTSNRSDFKYEIEEDTLDVEGVLVPQKSTVISSSKDGKIAKIHFDNGDMFRKGDILVEYSCEDLKAELDVANAEKDYTGKRVVRNQKLLNLDIISDIEHLGVKTEDVKAEGQARIIESRMEQCYIRAAYDGRVTNRLANDHEYTRSDRVLMEVASLDDLEIEFLLPSRWLRWVNTDAPVTLKITETGESYKAKIKRIYGEIDPVSQSIQISAALDQYDSPLLPGMSGTVHLDIPAIREAGITGFLETPRYSSHDTHEEMQ